MTNCISLVLTGHKLNCIANHLGRGPNVGLVGSILRHLLRVCISDKWYYLRYEIQTSYY